MSTLSSEAAIH